MKAAGPAAKVGAVVLFAGLVLALFVIVTLPFEVSRMLSAETWPSRQGVIEHSYAARRSSAGQAPWYVPEICGRYLDDGTRFCITRIRYGGFRWGSGERDARETALRYPKGATVQVYADPEHPKETILEPQPRWNVVLTLGALAAIFLATPLVLWLLRRRRPVESARD